MELFAKNWWHFGLCKSPGLQQGVERQRFSHFTIHLTSIVLWTHQVSLLLVSPLSSFGVDFQSCKLGSALLKNSNRQPIVSHSGLNYSSTFSVKLSHNSPSWPHYPQISQSGYSSEFSILFPGKFPKNLLALFCYLIGTEQSVICFCYLLLTHYFPQKNK